MTLADFFAPLSIFNLFLILLVFYQLEILGFFIANKLKFDEHSRFSWWILGLGIFVFIWFIFHFFVAFNQALILLSLAILSSLTFPFYVNNQAWKSLYKSISSFPIPFLLLAIVIRRLSFWISTPPYSWDEMAYHYYPVSRLLFENNWPFQTYEFYIMLPRFFETAYVLVFSVTKTQVAARLLHFGIFFSVIQSTSQFLRKRVSYLSAVVFSTTSLFLSTARLKEATTGYIDAGLASLLIMVLLSLVLLIKEKKSKHLLPLGVWLSLALGGKYSVLLLAIVIFVLVLIFFVRDNFKKIKLKKYFKLAAFLLALGFVFGGFWYLKNLVYTYNPIYPFVLPCKEGLECGSNKSFFEGWTVSFAWKNKDLISLAVFDNNPILLSLTVISALAGFVIAFATKKNLVKIFLSILIVSIFFEVLLASRLTGFVGRYFLHWSLYVPLFLALPWMRAWKPWPKSKLLKDALIFLLLIMGLTQFRRLQPMLLGQIEVFNQSQKMLPPEVKAYAKKEIDIYDWTKLSFPEYYQVIHWCGDRAEATKLVMADPELIWTSGNGLARAFFVYCSFDADLLEPNNFRKEEKINKYIQDEAYLTSLVPCDKTLENNFEDEKMRIYFELNQELVCQSEEIIPGIYKLKK